MAVAIKNGEADRAEVFRSNMRALLEERWLSQRKAAEEIGVDYKWMRRACHRGLKRIDSRTKDDLDRVAQFFGVETVDLWDEKLQQRPNNDVLIKWSGGKRRQADAIVQHPIKDRHVLRTVRWWWSSALPAAEKQGQSEEIPLQRYLRTADRPLESDQRKST